MLEYGCWQIDVIVILLHHSLCEYLKKGQEKNGKETCLIKLCEVSRCENDAGWVGERKEVEAALMGEGRESPQRRRRMNLTCPRLSKEIEKK